MKNLKKVLSLGLALVMLLGMFTVVSAAETKKTASDLTDWNTVQHKDAVSLMVDLGIIVGTDKGTFEPTGNIDRASWAKMVYFAATGSDNADNYLGTATGLNDIAGNWAESYISFLKANNYISGDTNGNYNPGNNVTVAEACKMMLTVLGYDAEDRGYQNNTAWSGNIIRDAKRDGLLDNVDSEMQALVPLTRENAAEIVLNTLNANMVEGEPQWDGGVKHIAKYNDLHTLGYEVFGMVKLTAIVDGIDKDGMAVINKVTEPADGQKFVGSITNKVKASAAVVGENVNVYIKGEGFKWDSETGELSTTGDFKNIISTTAAKAASTPVKVLTGGIAKIADITERSSANYVAGKIATDVAYYLNGESTTKDAFQTAIKKRGTVVEFYLDENGDISVMKAYSYTVKQVTGAPATKTLSDGTLQVRVPGVLNGYVDADKVNGWQGLEADDVVLCYTTKPGGTDTANQSWTMEKAEMITGKVSTNSDNGTLTINGQKYRISEQKLEWSDTAISEDIFKAWSKTYNLADEFNFWLDKNGSIVAAKQITESMDNSKVCLVIETEVTDKALGSSGSLAANLLFVDGSTEIVNVSKVATAGGDLKAVVDNVTNEAKQIKTSKAQEALTGGSRDPEALEKFFNYRSTSTGYELTELSSAVNSGRDWEDVVTADAATIVKQGDFAKNPGSTTSDLTGMLTANLATTFIIGKQDVNDGTWTYSVAKGFRELHEMDATKVTAIAVNSDPSAPSVTNTVAKYVYLETTAFKDDAPDGYIFITSKSWNSDPELYEDGVYQVNIIDTDGAATTMRVDEQLRDSIINNGKNTLNDYDANGNMLYKFFQIGTIDENRVVSALGANGDGDPATMGKVEALGSGVVKIAGLGSFDYDDATKFIFVDMGWTDGENDDNVLGVRNPVDDIWTVTDSGTFDPETFFDAADIDSDVDGTNPDGKTCVDVLGTVITPDTVTKTADYVYIVRFLW